mgnify:FL=1
MTEPTDAEIDALLRPFYESDDAAEMAKYDDRLTARAVLAKWGTPAPVGVEPYAQHAIWHGRDGDRGWDQYHDSSDPMPLGWDGDAPDEVIDLYTAAQAQAGAVPLTDERLDVAVEAWFVGDNNYDFRERMRAAIDAAHGIKGGQHDL